jgi:hypothetical protein
MFSYPQPLIRTDNDLLRLIHPIKSNGFQLGYPPIHTHTHTPLCRRHLEKSGDVSDCHNWGTEVLTRDVAEHPAEQSRISMIKNYLAQNVNSASVKKKKTHVI